MIRDVDAIVIGSGQGGKEVVLFERGAFGGTCINAGCTPSKAFLAVAHAAGRARRAKALGVRGDVTVDFPFVMERVRDIIDTRSKGVRARLLSADGKIVLAEGSFSGERTVTAGSVTVRAPLVIIDTGARTAIPPTAGSRIQVISTT